jgi:hypothetical protein
LPPNPYSNHCPNSNLWQISDAFDFRSVRSSTTHEIAFSAFI